MILSSLFVQLSQLESSADWTVQHFPAYRSENQGVNVKNDLAHQCECLSSDSKINKMLSPLSYYKEQHIKHSAFL